MKSPRSLLLALPLLVASASAFTATAWPRRVSSHAVSRVSSGLTRPEATSTALQARRWNFNEGSSPWGLKANAEVWNGRVAQMAFVFVFLQELIQGKGVIQGIQEGDPLNIAGLAIFAVSALGLTAFLAIQGDDDYVKRDLERDGIKYK